jgi:hypothetical protein
MTGTRFSMTDAIDKVADEMDEALCLSHWGASADLTNKEGVAEHAAM